MLLLAGLLLSLAAPVQSEGQQCEPCEWSREFYAAGDTIAAVTTALRYSLVPDAPVGATGTASGDASTRQRSHLAYLSAVMASPELRVLLSTSLDSIRALDVTETLVAELVAEPPLPHQEALAAYAVLEFKRDRLREGAFGAVREFGRRVSEAPELMFPGLSSELEAELLLLLATRLSTEIKDGSFRVDGGRAAAARYERCADTAVVSWNVTYYWDRLDAFGGFVRRPADLVGRRRRFLERAFDLAPHLDGVARSLLGDLARDARWEEYDAVARRHAIATSRSGWSLAYLGVSAWRGGLETRADSLFAESLDRMSQRDAAILLDVAESVFPANQERFLSGSPAEARAWSLFLLKVSDPLFLTHHNERRLEHLTRVTLAELWFSDLLRGVAGSTSDPGRILIRYGDPLHITELSPNDPMPPVPEGVRNSLAVAVHAANDTLAAVLWGYGADRPTFLFMRRMGQPDLRLSSRSLNDAFDLRSIEPSTYDFAVSDLSHQVARFKGRESTAEVDFYTEIPGDTLSPRRIPVRTGVFVLPRVLEGEVFALTADAYVGFESRNVTLRIPFTESEYVYNIEMLSEDESVKSAARRRMAIEAYLEDRMTLSDLVLARSVSNAGAYPANRQDLAYDPAVDLTFGESEPVSVLFEVYPSRSSLDALSTGRQLAYSVAVRIRNPVDGTIVEGRSRQSASGDLAWIRTGIAGEDRVLDWFTLDVPWPKPGLYEIEVEIEIPDHPPVSRARRLRVTPPMG